MNRLALIVTAACAVAGAACGGGDATVVFVTVEARDTVREADVLRVEVKNAGATIMRDFALPAGSRFPVTFTVTPEGRDGDLEITAVALQDDLSVGRGRAIGPIVEGRSDLTILIDPDDFVVNRQTAETQWLTFREELVGRQIGVSADGSFLVAWENSCPLGRCDLLARLFGADTQPRENDTSLTPDDFIVQQSPDYTESPAVAAGPEGYLVAWLAAPDIASALDIRATAFTETAGHVNAFDELLTVTAENETAPNAIALEDGRYVVFWSKPRTAPATGSEIRARIVDENAAPIGGEILVSASTTGEMELPHGAPLEGGGFVIVWAHRVDGGTGTNVRARVFGSDGLPVTPIDSAVTSYTTATVYAPHVAAIPGGGFVATWQVFDFGDQLLAEYPLRLRLFSNIGASESTEITITRQTIDFNAIPTVAVRQDGAIGVSWHDCGERGDGQGCGIRLRMFHPGGLPSGYESIVNTTLVNDQRTSTIVAFEPGAFLVGWTDGSGVPPDEESSGVRARVIYPSLERHDGAVGAACGGATDAACGDDLVCAPSADGPELCHPTCSVPDGTVCGLGGTCMAGVCTF